MTFTWPKILFFENKYCPIYFWTSKIIPSIRILDFSTSLLRVKIKVVYSIFLTFICCIVKVDYIKEMVFKTSIFSLSKLVEKAKNACKAWFLNPYNVFIKSYLKNKNAKFLSLKFFIHFWKWSAKIDHVKVIFCWWSWGRSKAGANHVTSKILVFLK